MTTYKIANDNVKTEPVRTVHHFACTGGTLFSKCIATTLNTQLVSEINPFHLNIENKKGPFIPTDIIGLLQHTKHGISLSLRTNIFLNSVETILTEYATSSLRLVLRDHTHSHYCLKTGIPERPTLRELMVSRFPVLSLVTVRNPIDSYLSAININLIPFSFDEYCRRYLIFLHDYEGVPRIRYEDFVAKPEPVMQEICTVLKLPFNEYFQQLFYTYHLSGDSGRTSNVIEMRPRRPVSDELQKEIEASQQYWKLSTLLGYGK